MWFYLLMNVVTQYPFAGSFIHVSVLFSRGMVVLTMEGT